MRQAVATMIVGLSLALTPVARASATAADASATIAQARRLIEAKDYSPATILLEDLLPEANATERTSILDLLRQSFDGMAREADAAGNDRAAAQFRENIAIINRSRGVTPPPVRASEKRINKPVSAPGPVMGKSQSSGAGATTRPLPAPRIRSVPASPREPAPASAPERTLGPLSQPAPASAPERTLGPLSEPAKTPAPENLPRLPKELESSHSPNSDAATEASPRLLGRNVAGPDQGDVSGLPHRDAALNGAIEPSAKSDSESSARHGESRPKAPLPSLEEGDRLFTAGRYDAAGRCYSALAHENRLPAHRTQQWAYCRMVEVARKINLRPRTTREWDEIAAEIASIQRLTPSIWYGEYLRNKVAEVRRGGRGVLARSENLIVRGAEPDESQKQPDATSSRRFPRLFGKLRGGASAQPESAAVAAAPLPSGGAPLNLPADSSEPGPPGRSQPREDPSVRRAGLETAGVAWQVYETPNFRVFHQDARLAEAAGNAAELVRTTQAKRWASPAADRPWTPPCDLYLYPSGKVFARETKQPENSPGFSTMMCNGNRVVARRMNLRADHPLLVTAILPHEVTHVVLADLFTDQQIPRWADEGIAVLAEPRAEQETRAAELKEPLEAGRAFDLRKLMAMDYPDARDWSLYYAQSVSLTRFLVEQSQPERFLQFVRNSQRDGLEGALRGSYGIGGIAELQERWMEYARQRFTPPREASRESSAQPDGIAVK